MGASGAPTFSADPFSDNWVDELVERSASLPPVSGLSATVALEQEGRSDGPTGVVLRIVDGRLAGRAEHGGPEPDVRVPLTDEQVAAWAEGLLDLSEAYMKGDLKPVGSTGGLLAAFTALP